MARRRIIIVATASDTVRQAIHAIFSSADEWLCIDATTGEDALEAAKEYGDHIALFLMDVQLADAEGMEAISVLQAAQTVDSPPLILMLPREETISQYALNDVYHSEVIETPIDFKTAQRRLRGILELHDYQRKDVSYQHTISRDPLIGLLNGASLQSAINSALSENPQQPGVFLYINVDNTRAMNERSGYHFGDLVLVDVARAISDALPPRAIIGRPHGDTFCAFIPDCPNHTDNIHMLEGLKTRLRQEYPDASGGPQLVTCCIGAAESPRHGGTFYQLLTAAETANGAAKQIGRNVMLFYNDKLHTVLHDPDDKQDYLASQSTARTLMTEWFTPVINGTDQTIMGYEYLPLATDSLEEAPQQAAAAMSNTMPMSMIHLLRVDIRRFFQTMHDLTKQGSLLTRFSFYTVLPADQAEMLPQMLQEALATTPVDTSRVCINISHEMVMGLSRGRLNTLAHEIKGMGFAFGVHNVGADCIGNVCYEDTLFDRILFCPKFTNDLVSSVYPPAFLENVVAYFSKAGIEIFFPMELSPASRVTFLQTLGSQFGYYGQMLPGVNALVEHYETHTQRSAIETKRKKSFLRISDDRYSEIFSRSGIIIMDWRPHDDSLALSESFAAVYGHPKPGVSLPDLLNEVMHPDDVSRVYDLFLQIKHGRPSGEGIFRVRRVLQEPDAFKWRRFYIISISEESGVVSHVYCISFDVDRERREMQDIMKKAETDPLTQLYNRGATEGRICDFLAGEGKEGQHALMIIDLDDFKSLNDRLGHIAGDKALQFLADQMQALFRRGDIIGRIGGDEFMVFLKNIASERRIGSRAEDICKSATLAPEEWQLSCTVGIARYPLNGTSFQELYAKADLALYEAKNAGKNHYTFFTGDEVQK